MTLWPDRGSFQLVILRDFHHGDSLFHGLREISQNAAHWIKYTNLPKQLKKVSYQLFDQTSVNNIWELVEQKKWKWKLWLWTGMVKDEGNIEQQTISYKWVYMCYRGILIGPSTALRGWRVLGVYVLLHKFPGDFKSQLAWQISRAELW